MKTLNISCESEDTTDFIYALEKAKELIKQGYSFGDLSTENMQYASFEIKEYE